MRSDEFWAWYDTKREWLMGRADTFAKMFEFLDKIDRPVHIVETGTCQGDDEDNWRGAGCSTVLFDRYIQTHPKSRFYSIDNDKEACRKAKELIKPPSEVWWRDSIEALEVMQELRFFPIDLLYLDGSHLHWADPLPSASHHLKELYAAMPLLQAHSLVAVDDSPVIIDDPRVVIGGKGELVAQHARYNAANLEFSRYQVGWTDMLPKRQEDHTFIQMLEKARKFCEEDKHINAEPLYWLILHLTRDAKTATERVARGEACVFFARLAMAKEKFGAAADYYRDALHVDPLATDYRIEFVVKCLRQMSNTVIAKQEAVKATKIDPDNPDTWRTLGGVEHELNNAKGCIEAYDKQLALIPDDANAKLDRITIALDVADYRLAEKLAKEVLETDRKADALHCLAMVAYRESRHEQAIELYKEAIAGNCRHLHTAWWNMSLALHSIGRYREGWIAHEHRIDERTNPALSMPLKRFVKPLWKNEGEPPSKIHIHCESGAGDNLVVARYLPMVAALGHEVTYECPDDMETLMRRSFPMITVRGRAADYPGFLGLKPFDYHLPIGSLAHVFGTDIDTVPWNGPYLHPDPALVEFYRKNFPPGKIGLCWSSGVRRGLGLWLETYGERKSLPFEALRPLLGAKRSVNDFVSLQVGPERKENDCIADILPEKPTWDDTAALIACLDLVITPDTAVAHMAGAMGKPVWVMAQRDCSSWHLMCWRPGASWNEASPWYPSMRIFRQHEFNRPYFWDEVVEDVVTELRNGAMRKVA